MPNVTVTTTPDPAARAYLAGKIPVPAGIGSAQWGEISQLYPGLSETAQFSAYLESARTLERINLRVREAVAGLRRSLEGGGEGAFSSRSAFINEIRQLIIDETGIPFDGTQGTIQDPTSEARLRLIYDIQVGRAVGYAGWKAEQNPSVLAAAPAQELIRVGQRRVPRDWITRWREAGGEFYQGRMIARKDDPIWTRISRFGTPFPPFDFNSGMGLRDVLRREALQLGVITKDDVIQPQDVPFTENLQASVSDLSPESIEYLKRVFGDKIEIVDGVAKWKGAS